MGRMIVIVIATEMESGSVGLEFVGEMWLGMNLRVVLSLHQWIGLVLVRITAWEIDDVLKRWLFVLSKLVWTCSIPRRRVGGVAG